MRRGPAVSPTLVGLISAGLMLLLLIFAFGNVSLFSPTLNVNAQVSSADTLAPGADVEIAGVKVGTVKTIDKGNAGALVSMSVDPRQATLFKDVKLAVRPHGVFGPKFVQLYPGTDAAGKFSSGGTIDIANTSESVDFEQVLNQLDPNTRVSLQTVFYELGTGAQGRGADFGSFIDNFNVASAKLTPVLQTINGRTFELGRLFDSNAVVSETFAASPLDQILKENSDILAKLEAVRPDLTGVIDHGNAVFADIDVITSGNHVQELRTTIQKLPGLLDNLSHFNRSVGFATNSLNPVLVPQKGQTDGDIGLAIKRTLDAFGECDTSDQTATTPQGLLLGTSDTERASFVKIEPCLGPDGKPLKDAAGNIAHHHVKILLGLETTNSKAPGSVGQEELDTVCGPGTLPQYRGKTPAFSCKVTSQSQPPPPVGGAPPPLFSPTGVAGGAAGAATLTPMAPVAVQDLAPVF